MVESNQYLHHRWLNRYEYASMQHKRNVKWHCALNVHTSEKEKKEEKNESTSSWKSCARLQYFPLPSLPRSDDSKSLNLLNVEIHWFIGGRLAVGRMVVHFEICVYISNLMHAFADVIDEFGRQRSRPVIYIVCLCGTFFFFPHCIFISSIRFKWFRRWVHSMESVQ